MFITEQKQLHIQDLNSKQINNKLFLKVAKKYKPYIFSIGVESVGDGNRYDAILINGKLIAEYTWSEFYYSLTEYIKNGSEL